MMDKSTPQFRILLDHLDREARAQRFTDTEWATRAGIRKETLSRMRGRNSCDFATLQALAKVVGASLMTVKDKSVELTPNERFPAHVDRGLEEVFLDLCASRDLTHKRWQASGPSFFMAGLAVMVASVPGFDRRALLDLAEQLHAGSSQVGVFALWLENSPVRPSRFLAMLANQRHAA